MNYPKLPSFRLDGKKALVTGAGRGIGMGASIALAESGANVTLISRTEKELKDLTDHINNRGYKASYEVLDVSREEVMNRLLARGRVDDTREIINNRIDLYKKETGPVVEYFRDKPGFIQIRAEGEPDIIGKEIIQRIENEGK